MATLKVRHLVEKSGRWYFQPTAEMKHAGFQAMSFGDDVAEAVRVTQALNNEWDVIRKHGPARPGTVPGTVRWLAIEYKRSSWFQRLAPRTKGEGDRHIERVISALGNVHVATLRRRHVRRFHEKLVQAKGESQANEGAKWLRRMLTYAVELELLPTNPAAKLGLHHGSPRRVCWTREEVEAFKATAIEHGRRSWALAVQLGYDTSADLSDILRLTWHDFDGEAVTFRRAKTAANPGIEDLWVPLSEEGLRMLAETERRAVQIVTGDVQGKPIGHRSFFGRVFRELRTKSGIRPELRFRDLRRTAISEVEAGGGKSEPISGHRPGSPVKRHYVVFDKEAARAAQKARRRDES